VRDWRARRPLGQAVKAVVVLRPGFTATADELMAFATAGWPAAAAVGGLRPQAAEERQRQLSRKEVREPYWPGAPAASTERRQT
jgi:hypothetical protein